MGLPEADQVAQASATDVLNSAGCLGGFRLAFHGDDPCYTHTQPPLYTACCLYSFTYTLQLVSHTANLVLTLLALVLFVLSILASFIMAFLVFFGFLATLSSWKWETFTLDCDYHTTS